MNRLTETILYNIEEKTKDLDNKDKRDFVKKTKIMLKALIKIKSLGCTWDDLDIIYKETNKHMDINGY